MIRCADMAKKSQSSDILSDAARAIGSAMGSVTHQAETLAAKAKKVHMPTKSDAKDLMDSMISATKKLATAAQKSVTSKKPAPKKSAPAKAKAKVKAKATSVKKAVKKVVAKAKPKPAARKK